MWNRFLGWAGLGGHQKFGTQLAQTASNSMSPCPTEGARPSWGQPSSHWATTENSGNTIKTITRGLLPGCPWFAFVLSVILEGLLILGDSGDLNCCCRVRQRRDRLSTLLAPTVSEGVPAPSTAFCLRGHRIECTSTGVVSAFSQASFPSASELSLNVFLGTVSLDF